MNSNTNNNSSNNRMPVIEIDDDIIDLDGQEKTPEEVVYEWDAKIRKQLTNYSIVDNENILVEFMKEYLKSAEDMAHNYDENDSFRRKVLCHTTFFYSYFTELKCCITDNYLDIMEDILTLYCNIELKVVRLLKRKDSNKREYKRRIASVCRRIIHVITVYLLEKTDHMLHVLIKLNYNCNSESCIKILNVLYRHFLTEVPVTNFNDESFCRTYILFQKWKQIRKTEEWQEMDETMYKMYKRNADSIRTNDTLKTILMPTCQSTVDVLLQLFRPIRDISDAYFKHIKEKKNIEIEDLDFNIDLGEDDLNPSIDENKENESDDDVEFMRAYKEIEQNMSILRNNNNNDFEPQVKIKHEKEDEEDEVVFISYTSPSIEQQQQVKDLFITEEDSQSSNSFSCTSNTKESATVPNSDNDNPPTPCDSTVQSNSVEISSDMQSPSLQTSVASSPLPTVKTCSVSTCTENLPDSNSISDDSCVINNDNSNNIVLNNDKSDDSNISGRKIVATRTVEIQADEQAINKNCLYSYGLVTPPSDVPTDDHNTRTVETCVYTDIVSTKQNLQYDNIRSSIEEQDEETIKENETPVQESEDTSEDINDIEDYHENQDNAITTDIESDRFDNISKTVEINDNLQNNSIEPIHYEVSTTTTTISNQSQFDTTDITNHNDDIDAIETNLSSDSVPHDDHEPICNHFEEDVTTDTGQVDEFSNILNVENESVKSKDLASSGTSKTLEPVNGNTIIKPLNPTQDGHNKILFTSTQTIRNTTLEEFSKFEDNLNWNKAHDNDFDDVLSGPISKMSLNKNHQLINDEKLDFFNPNSEILQTKTNSQQQQHVIDTSSRSNSPNEMLSPAFETIDDFRIQDFYNNDSPIINVNGGINRLSNTTEPLLSTPIVPPSTNHGILKKTSGLKKKTQISFGEDTFYKFHSDEKRTRSSMVRDLLKNDQKLRMDLRVNLQRLPFIENTMKKVVESARMIRVDYDKTTTYINKNDIVRCVSPPPLSWTYRSFDSGRERHNSGNIDLYNSNSIRQESDVEDTALNLTVPSKGTNPDPFICKTSLSSPQTLISPISTVHSDPVTEKIETEINLKLPSPTPLQSSDFIKFPEFPKQGATTFLLSAEFPNQGASTPSISPEFPNQGASTPLINPQVNSCNESLSSPQTLISSKLTTHSDLVTEKIETEINLKLPSPTPLNSSNFIKIPEFPNQGASTPLSSPQVNSFNDSVSDYGKSSSPTLIHESEFSNSPQFLQNSEQLLQTCLEEPSKDSSYIEEDIANHKSSLLSNNSNFYVSEIITDKNSNVESCKIKISKVHFKSGNSINNKKNNNNNNNNKNFDEKRNENSFLLPTVVPETYDFDKNLKNEVFSKIDWQTLEDFDFEETRLPLKKRKLSVAQPAKEGNFVEKQKQEEISYPATPMISIAEVEDLHLRKLQSVVNHNTNNIDVNQVNSRPFKTPAERKEMPPLPDFYGNNADIINNNNNNEPSPRLTNQFNVNNYTYNNPTINYHVSNVPVPFLNVPCGPYYSLPSFFVPFNTVPPATYETGKNLQVQDTNYFKKEARRQQRRKRN